MIVGLVMYMVGWYGQVRRTGTRSPGFCYAPLWLRVLLGVPWQRSVEVLNASVQVSGIVYLTVYGLTSVGLIPPLHPLLLFGIAIVTFFGADMVLHRKADRGEDLEIKEENPRLHKYLPRMKGRKGAKRSPRSR